MNDFRKNILIICEGKDTEPQYLNKIRDLLIENDTQVTIEIRPRPEKKKEEKEYQNRIGAIPRKIIESTIDLKTSEIEDEYIAQPTRYVREAQLGLEDKTFDEVWAVFDKDGHPNHKEAFALAQKKYNEKQVNIAFTSIAFEYWILLHFENNNISYAKSMCRINLPHDKKEYLYCGTKKHVNDCKGTNCVCGRIVEQGFLKYENNKKSFDYNKFYNREKLAIERAIQLRHSYQNNPNPIYELNPYTNIDRLVFKLRHLNNYDFSWFNFSENQTIDNMEIVATYNSNTINISIIYKSNSTYIFNSDMICLLDINCQKIDSGIRKVFYNNDENHQFEIVLSNLNINPIYIGYKISNKNYSISEIPK